MTPLFGRSEGGRFPLAPLLQEALAEDWVGGERYRGRWFDLGSPARLQLARAAVEDSR